MDTCREQESKRVTINLRVVVSLIMIVADVSVEMASHVYNVFNLKPSHMKTRS